MCSNQTLKCLLNNQSIISEAYDRSSSNQIKIFFKNKFKLLTNIDSKTTFNDLKLALLVSFYKTKYSNKHGKFVKKFDLLKQKATNDYVICESVNSVEKVINSNLFVLNELKRINRESRLIGDFQIIHIMRSKHSLLPLPSIDIKRTDDTSDKIPILREFYSDDSDENSDIMTTAKIDEQLNKFDEFIQQRKVYINLLEKYLDLLDSCQTQSSSTIRETFV